MGAGHFACLGCNGYFATGHWGGDGAAVAAPTIVVGGVDVRRGRRKRRVSPRLLELFKDYLEMKLS